MRALVFLAVIIFLTAFILIYHTIQRIGGRKK